MNEEDKEKLKNKVIKNYNDYGELPNCIVCGKNITVADIIDNNYEYTKNRRGERFAHSSCIKYKHKK